MTCRLIARAVPFNVVSQVSPFAGGGPMTMEVVCETHDILVHATSHTSEPLCAIGKIERATQAALQSINDATDDAIASIKG